VDKRDTGQDRVNVSQPIWSTLF